MKKLLSILTITFLLSACTKETGNPKIANQELIRKIEIGKTTKAEIEEWFGKKPLSIQRYTTGLSEDSFNYSYRKVKFNPIFSIPLIGGIFYPVSSIPNKDIKYDLSVSFGVSDKVTAVIYSSN